MSIAASGDGFTSSEDEGAVGLPPSGVVATAAPDPELTAMLARAAVSIGLEVNRPPSPEPSRLDDWFLGAGRGSQPRPAPVPFFPEVHEELTSSWMAPFTARSRSSTSSVLTTLDGGVARGYAGIPQVERAVAVHLCPRNAATWRNRPRLPSKACKLTAALAAKAYSAAGQAASALHAMAILQVHQAKAFKQVHEGSTDPGLMQELRTATDFALRATKVTARSLGKAKSTMVVQERHLWLNLAEMKDVDKARFLDAPISQGGLFGDTVEGFAQQFWTGPRLLWHINCLELWAVQLALRQLRPLLLGKHVLVRTDNTAAVSYINRLGGIRSHRMSQLAHHLLLWSHTQFKSLRAVHIPGQLNRAADALSRQLTFPGEWRLHPETIRLIWSRFGEAQVDLFASPESSHCQLYFSLTEGPLGTDALAHSWPRALRKYAFPPVSLLAQTLCKLREDEEQVLLVAPHWPTRTWFPELISLATAPPWRIPLRNDLLSQGLGTIWHPRPDLWNLHVLLLDGTRQTWVVYHRRW